VRWMGLKKNNGKYYTPPVLANFIAKHAIKNPESRVLDPCFGEGSLLVASYNRLHGFLSNSVENKLFGYDIDTSAKKIFVEKHPQIAEKCNLEIRNFFTVGGNEFDDKFDVVLMNPPFVRHHLIDDETLKRIRKATSFSVILPKTSDLWSHFVIHCLKFIKKGGSLVVVLPWSFIFASFASRVRENLVAQFNTMRVILLGSRLFKRAGERILVFFGEGFGKKAQDFGIFYSDEIPEKNVSWLKIDQDTWTKFPWRGFVSESLSKIFSKSVEKSGFRSLENFADIRIGTVTGANDFFVFNNTLDKKKAFPKKYLRPIIRKSKDLSKLSLSKSDVKESLLIIPEGDLPAQLKEYISEGEKRKINERCHAVKRKTWYSIPDPAVPDAFLHYMTKEVPFIVMNSGEVLGTNSIHQLFFKEDVDTNTKKWIQLSMFTSISQLSVELEGRTYGGGVLKLEPTAASKILVYPGDGKSVPRSLENKVNKYLSNGQRNKAIDLVDNWFIKNEKIPKSHVQSITKCYREFKSRRLNTFQKEKDDNYQRT